MLVSLFRTLCFYISCLFHRGQIMNWILSAFMLPLSLSPVIPKRTRGIYMCANFLCFPWFSHNKILWPNKPNNYKYFFGAWTWRKCCRQSRGRSLVVEKHIKISTDPEMERGRHRFLSTDKPWVGKSNLKSFSKNPRSLWENYKCAQSPHSWLIPSPHRALNAAKILQT